MFLTLNHQNLDVYTASKSLVLECYKISNHLPSEERFGLKSQIRRAVLSVHLNISEAASRRSITERKRFYEIARGSLVEMDAAFDIADSLGYLDHCASKSLEMEMIRCFQMLTKLMHS